MSDSHIPIQENTNLSSMKDAFQKLNMLLKGQVTTEKQFKCLQIMDYKVDQAKKQLNLLVKCKNLKDEKIYDQWIFSEELLELEPLLLTQLLITKTKFGIGYINPDEEVMKDYKQQ